MTTFAKESRSESERVDYCLALVVYERVISDLAVEVLA